MDTKTSKATFRSLVTGSLVLFVLAHFAHHLLAALLSPLLPYIQKDFQLNYTQAGWLLSAFTLAYGASQVPAGWLADRTSPRILIAIGVAGSALAGLLAGLSPSYVVLAVLLLLLGITGGGYHPASSPLVSAAVAPENRGSALGIHQIGGTASHFLAPLIVAGVAAALGWRGSFIALAVPTIIFGLALYLILGRREYGRQARRRAVATGVEAPAEPGRWRRLVAFIAMSVATHSLIMATISFIPLFLVGYFEISKEAAAALLALAYSAGLWAGPLGGYLSDRFGTLPVNLVISLLAVPIIYFTGLVSYGWALFAILLGMGMSQYARMPIQEAYIISHTTEHNRSTVLGFYYFGSRGGPGLVMPLLGFLADRFGFASAFTFVAIGVAAVTLVSVPFLWGARR